MRARKKIHAADLFCGAGGTSHGLLMAANEIGVDLELVAINHWQVAINTHTLNHPYAKHLCTGLDNVDPRKLVPGGRLQILCGSPECTHHSNARGGKPMNDQSRSSAWHILRFAEALYIDNIIIENVPEFQSWGPIGADGRPLKSKRGHLFEQFIASLRALGYNVEWRILNWADYGDPTTRRRLFMICRRGNKPVRWPQPTHVAPAQLVQRDMFPDSAPQQPWRSAREIIDWSLPSRSIFGRKKPLADNTLLRIEAGLRKFWKLEVDLRRCVAEDLRPFLVVFRNNQGAASVDEPVPTLTTMGANVGLVQPFITTAGGTEGQGRQPHDIDDPVGTVLTNDRRALAEAFILPHPRKHDQPHGVEEPLRTVTATSADLALAEPFIVPQFSEAEARSVERPLGTVTTTSRGVGLCEAFVLGQQSCAAARSTDEPAPTVATAGAIGLTEAFLVNPNFGEREGQSPRCRSVDKPAPAVTSAGAGGVVEAFLLPNEGVGRGNAPRSVDAPVNTVTAHRGAGGVVEPFLVTVNHGDGDERRVGTVAAPMPTATSKIGQGICEPFLVEYYGSSDASAVSEPVPTVTTKDRFGVVEATVTRYMLDIRFRMLQPRELARAQGFPDSYVFTGKREDVVKQIGNAVPPNTAKALIRAVLA